MVRENAAQQHIREIRAAKGLDNGSVPGAIVRDLEAATRVLSEQLYQKSTRFLMELIQNADDNQYDRSATPTLHITYANNHLRVDCNEVGFTAKNVEAICSIGRSSKAEADSSSHYIGEKGIGFKAVFKVADVVWVSSGDYSFKFDKRQPLGMIAPILDRLPGEKRAGWTTFYLQLSPTYNARELVEELKSLDARLLMFLQRLKRIDVTIVEARDSIWSTSLKRSEQKFDGLEGLKLSQDANSINYVVMRHKIKGLQGEAKRAGISESDAMLAFPLDEAKQPLTRQQHVFAYLPIRDYGFKFLIQADFLLIASREDVDSSSRWNRTIRDQLINAFLESVQSFNKTKKFMRYLWPRFLPAKPLTFNFFASLKSGILERLTREAVTKTWDGNWAVPSSLIFVPSKFRDDSGKPLTMAPGQENKYLSPKYADDDYEYLKLIGVTEMDDKMFVAELKRYIESAAVDFQRRSSEWHSRLATALTGIRDASKPQLKDLPLIQLRTGKWVCANGNNVLFPGQAGGFELPGGIDVLVAHPAVMKDHARHHLYRQLGVKPFNMAEITELIVKQHAAENFDARAVIRKDLISQLHFLFSTGWRNRGHDPFWFATEQDQRALGHHLYIDRPDVAHSASKFFAHSREIHKFIHPEYLNAHKKDPEAWRDWLQANMRVSYLPHLVHVTHWDSENQKLTFEMNPDFEFVMQRWSWLDVLMLVCEHWDVYCKWLYPFTAAGHDEDEKKSYEKLRNKICTMMVETTDRRSCNLKDTFLPLAELVARHDGRVSFLNVPEPDHLRWSYLRHLGVGVNDDVKFYLRSLDSLKGTQCKLQQVVSLLEQIQARYQDDQAAVEAYFRAKDDTMIYIPLSKPGEADSGDYEWVPIRQCLWSGPTCLRRHFCLQTVYTSCHRLLTGIAGLCDASMRELVREVLSFAASDPVDYMRAIFAELDKFLEKDKTYTLHLEPIAKRAIWPISNTEDLDKVDRLISVSGDMDWYIADTELHRESFAGIVPLLSFPNDGIQRIERIINSLDLEQRRLSRCATSTPRVVGRPQFSQVHTQSLKAKAEFLTRLVPRSSLNQKETRRIIHQLQNIEVFTAERVIQKYVLKSSSGTVESRECQGNVALTPHDEGLKIFLREGYLETERNPGELVRNLATFSGIDRRPDGLYLLFFTIIEPRLGHIATEFRRANIPVEYPEDKDGDQDWLRSARRKLARRMMPDIEETSAFQICSAQGRGFGMLGAMGEGGFGGMADDAASIRSDMSGPGLGEGMRIMIPSRLSRSRNSLGGGGPPVDRDLMFKGEEFFSDFLTRTLKEGYRPEEHWTSPLRSRKEGMAPYDVSRAKKTSAFTIVDADGAWTTLAAQSGVPSASDWMSEPPTWHFDVKATRGPLAERFVMEPAEFENARRLSLRAQVETRGIPTDVVMLIRVFNVETKPEMRLFIDTWGLLTDGDLRLNAPGNYSAIVLG